LLFELIKVANALFYRQTGCTMSAACGHMLTVADAEHNISCFKDARV